MTALAQRAFYRAPYEASITYALYSTEEYFDAKMYNNGEGGMYFESENTIPSGSDILIRITDDTSGTHPPEACDGYRGEVMWCRKIFKENGASCYGVGVRFMVNRCDKCGEKFPYSQIHQTENFLFLCTDCRCHMDTLPEGKIRECLESYLMGNVL